MRIEHLNLSINHINIVNRLICPGCSVHGILINSVPFCHFVPFFHKHLLLSFLSVGSVCLKYDESQTKEDEPVCNMIEHIHIRKNLIFWYGQNGHPAVFHVMKINITSKPIDGDHIFQNQTLDLPIYLIHKMIQPFLVFCILIIQSRLVVKQRPFPVNQVIRCLLRKDQILIIQLKTRIHHVNSKKTSRRRNRLTHRNYRHTSNRIHIGRRNIDIPFSRHCPFIIVLILHIVIYHGFNLRIVGNWLCTAHGLSINLKILLTIKTD